MKRQIHLGALGPSDQPIWQELARLQSLKHGIGFTGIGFTLALDLHLTLNTYEHILSATWRERRMKRFELLIRGGFQSPSFPN